MKLQRIIESSGGRIRRQPQGCPPPIAGRVGLIGMVSFLFIFLEGRRFRV